MAKRLFLLIRVLLPSIFVFLCVIPVSGRVWAQVVILKIPVTQEGDYYKNFVAEGDSLKFTAHGNGNMGFSISNFSSPIIEVFDVTDSYRPRRLTNPAVTLSGSTYTVKFSDTVSGDATYLAIAMPEMKGISFNFITDPPTLKDTNNGADYIIII